LAVTTLMLSGTSVSAVALRVAVTVTVSVLDCAKTDVAHKNKDRTEMDAPMVARLC
jgi:hypothetical protein